MPGLRRPRWIGFSDAAGGRVSGRHSTMLIEQARLTLAAVDREIEEDNAKRSADLARPVELAARRAAAEREVQLAEAQVEAAVLREKIPAVAAELAKRGDAVRSAFDELARQLPGLVTVQGRFDAIEAQAKRLRQLNQVIEIPAVRRLGGLHRGALAMVDAALKMASPPSRLSPGKPR